VIAFIFSTDVLLQTRRNIIKWLALRAVLWRQNGFLIATMKRNDCQ